MNTQGSMLREVIRRIIVAINTTGLLSPMSEDPDIGIEEDSSQQSPPNITWVPLYDDSYRGPHEQPDDAVAFYETTTVVQAKVWGATVDEAIVLRDQLLIAGHTLYSPNAFMPLGQGKYSKSLSSGEFGTTIALNVGFVVPVIYREYQVGTVTTVNVTTPDAINPVPDPPPGPIFPQPVTPPTYEPGGLYEDDVLGGNAELLPP